MCVYLCACMCVCMCMASVTLGRCFKSCQHRVGVGSEADMVRVRQISDGLHVRVKKPGEAEYSPAL